MKTKVQTSIIALTALVAITFTSCQKQPSADFTTDKSEYIAGETVKLTNSSVDGKTYKWTMPDGQTSNDANVNYTLSETQTDASLIFKLEALSKNGKKTDDAQKSITVKAATGQLTVWTSNAAVGYIDITIDGAAAGTITSYYTGGSPACAATGCVTGTFKVGSHTIHGTNGFYTWDGTMSVTKSGCALFQLQ